MFPLIGKLVDAVAPQKIIPIAFFLRALFGLLFIQFVTVPDSWFTVFVLVGIVLTSSAIQVSTVKLFICDLPQDIRGAMMGIITFAG